MEWLGAVAATVGAAIGAGGALAAFSFRWGRALQALAHIGDELYAIKNNCEKHESRLDRCEQCLAGHEAELKALRRNEG